MEKVASSRSLDETGAAKDLNTNPADNFNKDVELVLDENKCDYDMKSKEISNIETLRKVDLNTEQNGVAGKKLADIDLFESMFEACMNEGKKQRTLEANLRQKLEISENRNRDGQTRISELETTITLLQQAISSIHNDLNLVEKLTTENKQLKEEIKQKEIVNKKLKQENEEKYELLENQIKELRNDHLKEVSNLQEVSKVKLKEKENQMEAQLKQKEAEVDKLRKDTQSQISLLSIEHEEKLAKLQRQKMNVTMNQQQQSSGNQEIFRRKLQHLKQEYESKVSGLKEQVKSLQTQLSQQGNRDVASGSGLHNRLSVSHTALQPDAKKTRRF